MASKWLNWVLEVAFLALAGYGVVEWAIHGEWGIKIPLLNLAPVFVLVAFPVSLVLFGVFGFWMVRSHGLDGVLIFLMVYCVFDGLLPLAILVEEEVLHLPVLVGADLFRFVLLAGFVLLSVLLHLRRMMRPRRATIPILLALLIIPVFLHGQANQAEVVYELLCIAFVVSIIGTRREPRIPLDAGIQIGTKQRQFGVASTRS